MQNMGEFSFTPLYKIYRPLNRFSRDSQLWLVYRYQSTRHHNPEDGTQPAPQVEYKISEYAISQPVRK
jgi:hypothetical protein